MRATKSTGATSSLSNRESVSISEQPLSGAPRNNPTSGRDGNRWGNSMLPNFNGGNSFADTFHDFRESFSAGAGGMGGGGGSFTSSIWERERQEYGAGGLGRRDSFDGSSFNGSINGSFSGGESGRDSFSGGGEGSVWEPGQDQRRGRAMSGGVSFSHIGGGVGVGGGLRNIMEPGGGGTQHKRRRRKKIVFIEEMPDKYLEEEQAAALQLLDAFTDSSGVNGVKEETRPSPMLYTTIYQPPPLEVSKARQTRRLSMNAYQASPMKRGEIQGGVVIGGQDEIKVTLADEILKMPVSV